MAGKELNTPFHLTELLHRTDKLVADELYEVAQGVFALRLIDVLDYILEQLFEVIVDLAVEDVVPWMALEQALINLPRRA